MFMRTKFIIFHLLNLIYEFQYFYLFLITNLKLILDLNYFFVNKKVIVFIKLLNIINNYF